MRPRLRDGVFVARLPEGTFALSPAGPVLLPGAAAAAWVERLVPHLDGRRTVDELAAGQPADRAAVLRRVVAALVTSGLATDAGAGSTPPAAERDRFAAEIAVAGADGGDGADRFRRWRGARVVVAAGPADAPVPAPVSTPVPAPVPTPVPATAAATAAATVAAAVELAGGRPVLAGPAGAAGAAGWRDPVAGADLVLHLAGRDGHREIDRLDEACRAAGVPLVVAAVGRGEAWIGPLGPAAQRVGWRAAWLRCGVPGSGADAAPAAHPAAGTLLRHRLVAEAVRQLTAGYGDRPGCWLVRLDLRTLASGVHPVVPHPYAGTAGPPSAGSLRRQVARLRAAPRCTDDELGRRALPAVDARLGLLRRLDDGGYAQLPLRIAVAAVADPSGPDRGRLRVLVAAGPDTATARMRAVRRGLAAYAAHAVDPRRLLPAAGAGALLAGAQDDAEAVLAELAAGRRAARVLGVRLPVPPATAADRATVVAVDAAAVFPDLGAPVPGAGEVELPAGVVAGRGWVDAVEAGLLAHCRRLTLAGLDREDHPCPVLPVQRVRLDPVAARYRAALADLRLAVTVRDVTGRLGVPSYAFEIDGEVLAYACARSPGRALRDGWEQVLLLAQARLHGESGYAPPPVPALPAGRRDPGWAPVRRAVRRGALVTAVRSAGEVPVAVPLDHDPEVGRLGPVVLHVLTVPAGRESPWPS